MPLHELRLVAHFAVLRSLRAAGWFGLREEAALQDHTDGFCSSRSGSLDGGV